MPVASESVIPTSRKTARSGAPYFHFMVDAGSLGFGFVMLAEEGGMMDERQAPNALTTKGTERSYHEGHEGSRRTSSFIEGM